MTKANLVIVAIVALCLSGLTVRSQVSSSPEKQGSVYTLRVYQDLVVVDVVVMDKKGNSLYYVDSITGEIIVKSNLSKLTS